MLQVVCLSLGEPLSHSLGLALVELLDASLATLLLHLALERGIEVVLDVVVGAARQVLGDLRPPVAVLEMKFQNSLVLLFRPSVLLDVRVQVVVPPLTALLADASGQVLSNLAPVLRTLLLDLVDQLTVFLLGPGAFDEGRVEDFLPTVEALHVRAPWK